MPHARRIVLAGGVLALALSALSVPGSALAARTLLPDTFHRDHRTTPKFQLEPSWDAPAGVAGEDRARAFLADRAADYGLPADLANLRLGDVRESLLGHHYVYRQRIAGIDVDTATISVSIAKADGRVYRVYNNTFPVKTDAAPRGAALDAEAAYDVAWTHLRAHGSLSAAPRARLAWTPVGEAFRLDWIVDLELSEPFGAWEVRVDAVTGAVADTRDASHYRVEDDLTRTPVAERIGAWDGPVADRRAEFARWEAQAKAPAPAVTLANGTGTVFDPDPRTTLNDDNLQDGSPASAFTAAYFTRGLLDISFNGSTYSLTGPWVNIINFESPNTAPSTTTTGNWTAVRGNNAFNDALTYYHVDKSQRHIQSLGFSGGTGIQDVPIGTDTDGLSGADNSHYIPGSNRMAFGHGCVDDSEDADVVLHEYGHAITYGANPSWGGGDAGAIGEGFGDYWAGSYSVTTVNGQVHRPDWVFSWDGHGTGNQCWPGRVMNADPNIIQYNHAQTYGAHTSIGGGYQSDELWSTPCFQSLQSLLTQGETRDSVDRIILEAMFGIGSGFKMRDMANSIIQAAGLLEPGGPHADTFTQEFLLFGIVDIPVVLFEATDVQLTSAGPNDAADPGETVTFGVEVTNTGTLGASKVSATLTSSTPGVVVHQGAASYPDLPPGASSLPLTDYSITIPGSHTCGDPVQLSLLVSFDDGAPNSTSIDAAMGTGVPQGASESVSPNLSIPDANPTGVASSLVVSGTGALVTGNLNVDIEITHTWIGDLTVDLQSPNGTTVRLHDRTGSSADDIIGNYPGTLTPAQSLAAFIGGPLDGTWKLTVADHVGQDTGTLHSWGINDVSGYDCQVGGTDVSVAGAAPDRFALYAARPNPFRGAGSATIRYAVPGAGATVRLAIYDVAGRHVRTLTEGFVPAGTHTAAWSGDDASGSPAAAGIYFVRLDSPEFRETRKLMLLK